jgi:hypothetical protein
MSLSDNGLTDLYNAARKLLGGRTDAEKAKAKADLEKAANEVEKNKKRNGGNYNPVEPVIETVTGIPGEYQNLMLFGVVGIILLLILKD